MRIALFLGWLAIALYLAIHHVFWRDEVRAFGLALTGDNVVAMAKAVHGEGHPLLWYLLLRAAHTITPVREVLPLVAFAIGAAGAAFFAWRAPLRPVVMAAVLLGGWMAYEYGVMARNYGIAMLLMFVIADRFARRRDGPLAMGGLLFLLANTNVPAVFLAGGFLLFQLVEIIAADGWRWSPALTRWTGAATGAAAGAVTCFLTVYPPFNEAAVSPLAEHLSPGLAIAAALNVAGPFSDLLPQQLWTMPGAAALLAVLMVAAPLSLIRRPGGFVAAAVVLPVLLLFFQLVYPGSYRHQALYLCFLVALYWMAAAGRGGEWGGGVALARGRVPAIATALFTAFLLLQIVPTASILAQTLRGRHEGQSTALGRLLARPGLDHAIVVGVPDVLVEPLPYYTSNPTFLLRQRRFGAITHFTRQSDMHLTLGGILATARRLQATTGRPVVLLMQHGFDPGEGEQRWDEGMLGDVIIRPGEAAAFRAATKVIATPVPLIRHGVFDEAYDVYLLRPRVTGS